MAVNVKMGVDIGGFTSGIKQGQQILKGLNAELKASESEFNATGNAEQKLAQQTKTLNSQITVQKAIAKNAEQALKRMREAGVDPADASYQKLYVQMMNAQAGANDAEVALRRLGDGAGNASSGADQLTQSLNNISKKMSLQQVTDGIASITEGLENAVGKAVDLGKALWDTAMDAASWADDTATAAQMYDMTVTEYQQVLALSATTLDTSADTILGAQDKFKRAVGGNSSSVKETLRGLGLLEVGFTKYGETIELLPEGDTLDFFFKAGQAIMALEDPIEQETKATELFGKSWKELKPLFETYQTVDEYRAALAEQNVVQGDTVENLAEMNDKFNELKHNFEVLKLELIGSLAPALTKIGTVLNDLLDKVIEYLNTEEGQEMMKTLTDSITGLFDDLEKIDPAEVVGAFSDALKGVVDAFKWLRQHKNTVVAAIGAIAASLGLLKVSNTVLTFVNTLSGLKGGNIPTGGGSGGGEALGTAGASAAGGATKAGLGTKIAAGASNLFWTAGVPALVLAAGVLPGYYAQKADEKRWEEMQTARFEAAVDAESVNAMWLRRAAEILGPRHDENGNKRKDVTGKFDVIDTAEAYDMLMALGVRQNQQRAELYNVISQYGNPYTNGNYTWDMLMRMWSGEQFDQQDVVALAETVADAFAASEDAAKIKIQADLDLGEDPAGAIEQDIGTVTVPVKLVPTEMDGEEDGSFANGTWSVPYDGFLARLHRGERVMPAREVASRNYSSNLYVESMYMNGGADADGLAAAMAAAQRRTMSGYGS